MMSKGVYLTISFSDQLMVINMYPFDIANRCISPVWIRAVDVDGDENVRRATDPALCVRVSGSCPLP